jgi:hypothetical protein
MHTVVGSREGGPYTDLEFPNKLEHQDFEIISMSRQLDPNSASMTRTWVVLLGTAKLHPIIESGIRN